MKIAVIGASGQTGLVICRQALERGHEVLALARTPAKVTLQHPALSLRAADIFDADSLAAGLAGAEAAITSVGQLSLRNTIPDFNVNSHRNIVAACEANGVGRLLVISSFGAAQGVKRKGLRRKIYLFLRRKYYRDMHDMEQLVLHAGLDATPVRAPMLHDRPPQKGYVVTDDGTLPDGLAISREDLASFLLDVLEQDRYRGRTVAIADPGSEMPPMSEILPKKTA